MVKTMADEDMDLLAEPVEIKLTISTPDVWTLGMWKCYNADRLAVLNRTPAGDPIEAKFVGAVALIKAQWCKIDGGPETEWVKAQLLSANTDNLDFALVGVVLKYIAFPLENAMDAPFLLKKSSPTTPIRNTMSVQ